ncbi:PVC-type heme-binding CxxCH protein [Verrucomicrobiota bacterium sgz303538]
MRTLPGSIFVLLTCILVSGACGQTAVQTFEIRDGDRVLFLGDTLLEREGTYGYLETRMHEQFPDRRFTTRNLSYSADTPHGLSRSVFDPADKGWERLKEQITMVKPTVVFLGYGMASSMDFVGSPTDRMAEPKRSTEEKVTRFRKEMEELMDAITATDPTSKVRFVLLSPIRHEDLRATNPALPDPSEHNQVLGAISRAAGDLSRTRGATFIDAFGGFDAERSKQQGAASADHITSNGIHLSETGYFAFSHYVADQLGWQTTKAGQVGVTGSAQAPLRTAIQRKNELFFHRWRPENQTYLFGFRKHEQGQNAKEIPMFDPLIDAGEAEIDRIKRGTSTATQTEVDARSQAPTPANALAQPLPQFDVQDGYEISLWAENPLLEKPIQMNWDAQGRLWIASSSVYPQIEPGAAARDRILLLEDTDRDGRADKSSVFAEGLLIPTAVIANVVSAPDADGKTKGTSCYVGQSTELLQLTDTDGDGKADKRESVLSGFGTEDTHHIVHTLRWGPDGRLYFDQSIYIHSHIETPWGVVRQNSGGVFAWDPRSQKLEVMYNGFWNPWGVTWDKAGEAFITDGAGFQGVSWGIRGAAYQTYEGSRRLLQSISPGSYPKFCGLELVSSPHFPEDWQNSLVTCDFRAHRVVHFGINDLSTGENPTSGYITKELPDIVRTNDVSFRPIDVKMGPDGALYVADWSNPVINHGEVDFRDPRRDKTHGRIWRITKKNAPLAQWRSLIGETPEKLQPLVTSASTWESQQAARLLFQNGTQQTRIIADDWGAKHITESAPRTRVHAMRELSRDLSAKNAELVLEAALKTPQNDPFYDYAAWLSINDLVVPWSQAVLNGEWKIDSPAREKQLEWALNAIDPSKASPILAKVMERRSIPRDGSGPWIELIGKAGNEALLTQLFQNVATQQLDEAATMRALDALTSASRLRNARPTIDRSAAALPLLQTKSEALQIRLVRALGAWKEKSAVPALLGLLESETSAKVSDAAGQALAEIGGTEVTAAIAGVAKRRADDNAAHIFENAVHTLAQLDPKQAAPYLTKLFTRLPESNKEKSVAVWRDLLKIKGGADLWASLIPADLPKTAAAAGVRAAREQGKKGEKLATALASLAGAKANEAKPTQSYAALADLTKRDGDPSRGEEIYRRTQLACVTCHAIGGAGGKVGPELTSLGASAPLDYIIESVLNPAAKVKEGYHAVNLTLKDGTVASGIQSRESAEEVFLRNVIGQETAVPKANIVGKENIGSIMPAGLVESLQSREQLDLFAFLSQLGKPGVYDASKGTVARVWKLLPGSDLENVASGNANLAAASNAFTNVDGRLSREQLQSALQLLPNATDAVVAVSRFQLPSAGRTNLTFTGVSKAWLDGKPLAVASEPKVSTELAAGEHVIAVKLDPKQLPQVLRAESQDVRFLTE